MQPLVAGFSGLPVRLRRHLDDGRFRRIQPVDAGGAPVRLAGRDRRVAVRQACPAVAEPGSNRLYAARELERAEPGLRRPAGLIDLRLGRTINPAGLETLQRQTAVRLIGNGPDAGGVDRRSGFGCPGGEL